MAEAGRLPAAQAWLSAPATRAVMAALEAVGGPACARFVGGCVRNALIGQPIDDVDIATVLEPQTVIRALRAAGLKAVPTGVEHGTATAVAERRAFEITTLRRDVETDGRRAVVAFTTDWGEDARRRDFRLNAVYADAAGLLYDPTGEGIADALAGRVVFVGDAETRIREDALRILRFFRFHAWYGRGEPDAAALAACAALKDQVRGLSAERVSKELLKLLAAEDPRPAVRLMLEAGVLAELLPQAAGLGRFERLVAIETGQLFSLDPLLRLGALLPADPAAGEASARRLRLSNAQRERLTAMLGVEPPLTAAMSPRQARAAVYRLGRAAFCDRALLAWAASDDTASDSRWRALPALAQAWPRPILPLTGDDALAAGAARGPQVGAALREVEAWWVENDFPDDRAVLLARLKAVAGKA
ncbi:MAG: CCA tRNA nucleotidyltransferase [Caulobacteraceae bacterium]|nr:CCA tRNA nucleotidyltransferase [Caulobacteraceae bacterium]